MDILERIGACGLVPVAVIEDAADAVPAARALLAGGIDTMEITLRTGAALNAIREVSKGVPEMLTGAGTVLNLDQAKRAVDAGARFIVSPGLDEELAAWCVGEGIPVTPGCVTPTEIMRALTLGLTVLKFFPANVYGGLAAMKGLAGPFGDVRFIPTGGINQANIGEYRAAPFVHAVGGSWVCSRGDISGHHFDRITSLCKEAVAAMTASRGPA